MERTHRGGGFDDHLDDSRRQAVHLADGGAQFPVHERDQLDGRDGGGLAARHHPADHGIALLGRGHGLHHVAGIRGVEIAEEGNGAAVVFDRRQYPHMVGLGAALGPDRIAVLVQGHEKLAVNGEVFGFFAGQHGVGLGAGGDQDRARGQGHGLPGVLDAAAVGHLHAGQAQGHGMAVLVELHVHRGQALGEADALLHGLAHLFVVEPIGRAVHHPAAVDHGGAAPAVEKFADAGAALFRPSGGALIGDGPPMGEEFVGDFGLLGAPGRAHRPLAVLGHQGIVALEELLHLDRVIGARLGGGVDGGQPATHHGHRQAHLQIGDGIFLGGAGQLQRHQEVAGGAHPAGQAVAHGKQGRLAGAGADRNMVEAVRERAFHRHGAAEAHAADHGEERTAL